MRVKFLVTPVGLMMGNIESARRLKAALAQEGLDVTTDREAQDFDLLHVHTPIPPSNMLVVKKAKKRGIPVVMHAHTTAEDSVGTWTGSAALSGITGMYLTGFYNLGDLVLAPSGWTKDRLSARGVRSPIRVLSNGIDLERFRFDPARRRRFRETHGIPDEAVVAYSIGVVCLKKGIETFPLVAKALPEVAFVWAGKRSRLYHPLKVNLAMRQCGQNVMFLHNVDDIVDAHCGGDLFFTPSFAENQGMAVMEAMAVGRPVIARDLPSYQGLLMNGKSALIGKDVGELVAALDAARRDPGLSNELVRGGREALSAHDMRIVARELISIYDALLERAGTKGGVGA